MGSFQACSELRAHVQCRLPSPQRREAGSRRGRSPRDCHTPPSSFLTPPSLLMLVVLPFSPSSLRNNQLFLFFVLLSLFFTVQTRHLFLMLKLLVVFCDGCSALSFLLPRMSLWRGRGGDERERLGLRSIWGVIWRLHFVEERGKAFIFSYF